MCFDSTANLRLTATCFQHSTPAFRKSVACSAADWFSDSSDIAKEFFAVAEMRLQKQRGQQALGVDLSHKETADALN